MRLTFGVPMGSILEPLLFLLFINNFINAISCTPRLFADDACLFFSSNKLSLVSLQTLVGY